jgi:hypothetical protein
VIFHLWIAVAGTVVMLAGVYGWAIEPASE